MSNYYNYHCSLFPIQSNSVLLWTFKGLWVRTYHLVVNIAVMVEAVAKTRHKKTIKPNWMIYFFQAEKKLNSVYELFTMCDLENKNKENTLN